MSGELLVTAIIVARGNGTAEDCSDALNAFSEQHQLEVTYDRGQSQRADGFQDSSTLLWSAHCNVR